MGQLKTDVVLLCANHQRRFPAGHYGISSIGLFGGCNVYILRELIESRVDVRIDRRVVLGALLDLLIIRLQLRGQLIHRCHGVLQLLIGGLGKLTEPGSGLLERLRQVGGVGDDVLLGAGVVRR